MATKSILKTVVVNDRKVSGRFVRAMEKAQSKSSNCVNVNNDYRDIKGPEITRLFSK